MFGGAWNLVSRSPVPGHRRAVACRYRAVRRLAQVTFPPGTGV